MAFELPKLPYSYDALEPHIDARTMEIHHTKHHQAYITNVNNAIAGKPGLEGKTVEALIANLTEVPEEIRTVVRNNAGGHSNHSFFWVIMSPDGGGEPDGELAAAIKESFGSVANLKGQLNEAALNVQGSGWGTLAWEPLAKRLVTEQVYDHQGNIGNGTVPLLVLDMWEHAYYLQYQNVKGEWVKAFWKIVNWEDVRQRLQKVRTLDLGL